MSLPVRIYRLAIALYYVRVGNTRLNDEMNAPTMRYFWFGTQTALWVDYLDDLKIALIG